MIQISINNKIEQLEQEILLSDYLYIWEQLQESDAPYAIALNGEFVARSKYEQTLLKDTDTLDIVSPVGGG